MDEMKKKNIKDYTTWDLNPSCFKPKNKAVSFKKIQAFCAQEIKQRIKEMVGMTISFLLSANILARNGPGALQHFKVLKKFFLKNY